MSNNCEDCGGSGYNYQAVVDEPGELYWHDYGAKGHWSVIVPTGKLVRNNVSNPSFEFNMDGWLANIGSTITRVAGYSTTGGYGLHVTGNVQPMGVAFQSGPTFATMRVPCGQKFYGSIDILARPGAFYSISFIRASIAQQTPPECFVAGPPATGTGTGRWERVPFEMECIDDGSANGCAVALYVEVQDFEPGAPEFYIDSARAGFVEVGEYFDGDSPGATWAGTPHASVSSIDQFTRSYGKRINLNEIGFNFISDEGTGEPTFENLTTPYAQLHGSHLDRIRVSERVITLVGDWSACDTLELHRLRKEFLRAIDYRFKNQCSNEMILEYMVVNCDGEPLTSALQIACQYTGGDTGSRKTPGQMRAALQFTSYGDQYFYEVFERSQVVITGQVTTIDNPGTEDSWLLVYFHPSGTGGTTLTSFENQTTGQIIRFGVPNAPLAIADGTYYVMDTTPRRGRLTLQPGSVNSIGQVRFNESDFNMMRLIPGENDILIQGNALVNIVRWRAAYTSIDGVNCDVLI